MWNKTCVAFGDFAFIHRGHRKIAETVVKISKEKNLTSVIVSWEQGEKAFTTEEEKEYLLKQLGIEMVLSFGKIQVEELLQILAAQVVVIGEADSSVKEVKRAAALCGIELIVVPTEKDGEGAITTERVEEAFEQSDFERVSELCDHPFVLIGEVVHGKALGRTEKMPTANIAVPQNKEKPKDGVYCTRIRLGDECFHGVTNIGTRPTVDNFDYVTIEVLILDFEREIYGEKVVLEIQKFIRDIRKFESLAEVKEQVDKDIEVLNAFVEKERA